jgi:hypothetical protein
MQNLKDDIYLYRKTRVERVKKRGRENLFFQNVASNAIHLDNVTLYSAKLRNPTQVAVAR